MLKKKYNIKNTRLINKNTKCWLRMEIAPRFVYSECFTFKLFGFKMVFWSSLIFLMHLFVETFGEHLIKLVPLPITRLIVHKL